MNVHVSYMHLPCPFLLFQYQTEWHFSVLDRFPKGSCHLQCQHIQLIHSSLIITTLFKAHGFSHTKWCSAKQLFICGGQVPIHYSTRQQRPTNASTNTHLWLATFFDVIGDHLPDGTIHLPISLTWQEVHSMCSNAHPPSIPILTYSSMLTHIDTYFSYVKLPKNSCLGKCSTCIEFGQQCLQAKSPIEAAQFAEACTNHLALSSAERLSYQECCHQAKSHPSVYMSLIIDYSNPLPLPTHSPVPKAWMHYGNRFTMVLGGLIDHSHGKHLFLHPQPFWPKDENLVISTLFHHMESHPQQSNP